MRYEGYFSLVFAAGERHFRVEFEVNGFDTPSGCLRRIARAEFNRLSASGLRLNRIEPLHTVSIGGMEVAIQPQESADLSIELSHIQAC